MLWSWVIIGGMTLILVSCLSEIACAFPTMGALYYWAFRLGGPRWGPFASWTAGWCNLVGQIAGVASGAYAGAELLSNIILLANPDLPDISNSQMLALFAGVLTVAGIVNTFSGVLLQKMCYISVVWHIVGVILIVILLNVMSPTRQPASYVTTTFNNGTPFESSFYVALIGCLSAASTFTGYDTAAHIAEETTQAHSSTPVAMLGSVINCIVLGILLIVGTNSVVTDIDELTDPSNSLGAAVLLWQQICGTPIALLLLSITFVGVECSNCANLTSATRMIYAFSRDKAVPLSSWWHRVNPYTESPLTAIWLAIVLAFLMGLPSLASQTALGALFSLTATGLYCSYLIPILLRVTVARKSFSQPSEFSLGRFSVPAGVISVLWALFMVLILCLPQQSTDENANTLNYSPVMLGGVLLFAWIWWLLSARKWFRGPQVLVMSNKLDKRSGGGPYDVENADHEGVACEMSAEVRSVEKAATAASEAISELASSIIPRFETRSARLGRRELGRPLLRVQLDQL